MSYRQRRGRYLENPRELRRGKDKGRSLRRVTGPISYAPRVSCNHIHESCYSKQLTMFRLYNRLVTVSRRSKNSPKSCPEREPRRIEW